jgi:excisionase family DNA binding protein
LVLILNHYLAGRKGKIMEKTQPTLFSIERLAERWDLSKYSVRRLIVQGELRSVTIGARRLIPISEVERAEQFGLGTPRVLRPKK